MLTQSVLDGKLAMRHDAFTSGVAPHLERLARVAARGSASLDEAEDVVQTTLLKGWRAYSAGAKPRNWGAWLITILIREMMNRRSRAVRYRRVLNALFHFRKPARTPREDGLSARIRRLPSPQREIVSLHFGEGLTFQEIADIIDLDPGTVRVYASRAMAALRSSARKRDGKDRPNGMH